MRQLLEQHTALVAALDALLPRAVYPSMTPTASCCRQHPVSKPLFCAWRHLDDGRSELNAFRSGGTGGGVGVGGEGRSCHGRRAAHTFVCEERAGSQGATMRGGRKEA